MNTRELIEGLTILDKYRNTPGGYNCGAEHDVIYAYPTDKPVEKDDLNRLVELGWCQPDVFTDGSDFAPEDYDWEQTWAAYV